MRYLCVYIHNVLHVHNPYDIFFFACASNVLDRLYDILKDASVLHCSQDDDDWEDVDSSDEQDGAPSSGRQAPRRSRRAKNRDVTQGGNAHESGEGRTPERTGGTTPLRPTPSRSPGGAAKLRDGAPDYLEMHPTETPKTRGSHGRSRQGQPDSTQTICKCVSYPLPVTPVIFVLCNHVN